MKKIIFILTVILGIVLFFSACEKNDKEPKLTLITAPQISNPANGSSVVLTLADSANPVIIDWTAASYEISGENELPMPTYSLQMDFVGNNFGGAKELVNTQGISYETIVYNLNNSLISLGMAGDSTGDIEFRVVSAISGAVNTDASSDIVMMTVTTFTPPEPPSPTEPTLWIPGDYQGWDPASAPVIYSYTDDGVFKGYMYMPEGGTYEFKFTSAPDWDHTNFGYGGEGLLDTDPGAGNLVLPGPGGYQVVVDTVNLTWNYGDGVQNWGVIGEWLAWAEDIDMIWDSDNQYLTLTIDVPDATNNRFKFRANDTWDVNLGAKSPDDGTLVQGGADIPIPAPGNYTFILDFKTELPTYQLIAN
ncbi:MAG: SusE domain-containing protein [Bacteroidales bacterium]|nr:SusE domain-containing protein [Bacteroidales bacterium]